MRNHPVRLLLVIGVAASIATTSVAWDLKENAEGTPAVLDAQMASARYRIHAELQGPGPFDKVGGSVWIMLRATARSMPAADAYLDVDVRSLTVPDEPAHQYRIAASAAPNGTPTSDSFPAWVNCATDPCVEDLEVTISRDPLADLPLVDVVVSAEVEAYATDETQQPPPGTTLAITVDGPL